MISPGTSLHSENSLYYCIPRFVALNATASESNFYWWYLWLSLSTVISPIFFVLSQRYNLIYEWGLFDSSRNILVSWFNNLLLKSKIHQEWKKKKSLLEASCLFISHATFLCLWWHIGIYSLNMSIKVLSLKNSFIMSSKIQQLNKSPSPQGHMHNDTQKNKASTKRAHTEQLGGAHGEGPGEWDRSPHLEMRFCVVSPRNSHLLAVVSLYQSESSPGHIWRHILTSLRVTLYR